MRMRIHSTTPFEFECESVSQRAWHPLWTTRTAWHRCHCRYRRTTNHEPRATAGSPTPRTPKRAGARSPDPPPARRTDSCRSPTAHLRPDLMGCFPRLGWIIALQSQSFIMNLSGSSVCVSVARGRPPRAHRPLRARPPPYAYVYVISISKRIRSRHRDANGARLYSFCLHRRHHVPHPLPLEPCSIAIDHRVSHRRNRTTRNVRSLPKAVIQRCTL